MILKNLSKAYLQEQIGKDLLDRLEKIIPAVSLDENPLSIYKHDNLIHLFLSFSGSGILKNRGFMKTLLNSLPPEKLQQICKSTDVAISEKHFDKKVEALLKMGWTDNKYCQQFLNSTGLPSYLMPYEKIVLPPKEELDPVPAPYKTLKDYQFQVYIDAIKELEKNLSRFVIQMPTGSGKTRTAMEFITEALNGAPEGKVLIWLAHSEELCDQAVQCFKDTWAHVGKRRVDIYRAWGSGSLPNQIMASSFIVAGFQKLSGILKDRPQLLSQLKNKVHVIIVDEAHKVLAPTYTAVVKALSGDSTHVVGLTATPGRSYDTEENRKLSNVFFKKIISIKTSDNETVMGLLKKKKVLSKAVFEPLISGRTFKLDQRQLRYMESNFDFPPGFLNELGQDDVRNLEIVRRLERESKQGHKILFFGCSVEHSKFICAFLTYLGFKAAHIDGSIDVFRRRSVLDDFKNGKIQIICNYGVLSTGFDDPKTDLVFIARPTNSLVLYSQMIGRGLRGPAIGGTEHCKIIDVRDNITNFSNHDYVYDFFADYWEPS